MQKFSFNRRHLSDVVLRQATLLPELRSLDLAGATQLGDSWRHLRNLKSIRILKLDHTGIGGEDLEHLSGLTTLKTLTLSGNPIRGRDLLHLRELQALTSLYLDRTNCFNSELAKDDSRGNLRHSSLFSPVFVGGNGIEHLLVLKKLKNLGVSETDITFDEAVRLGELPKLDTLLTSLGWSQVEWAQLRRLVPKVSAAPFLGPRQIGWTPYRFPYVPQASEVEYVDQIREVLLGSGTQVSSEGN